ncbi:MAG: hypothetical protein K8H74_11935 [Notoacmeibacter sp.]|nr:hypothetical protein [Notoacmeibacter sp.]
MADVKDYWLTFRIEQKTVDGISAGKRRDDLYAAIQWHAETWWLEPTSFVLFDSSSEIGEIASSCKEAIAPSVDQVLIRKLNSKAARIIGKVEDMDMLRAFMPYLSKV